MFLWNRDITFAKIDWGLISILTWYCHTAVLIKTCLSPLSLLCFLHLSLSELSWDPELLTPLHYSALVATYKSDYVYLCTCSWFVSIDNYKINWHQLNSSSTYRWVFFMFSLMLKQHCGLMGISTVMKCCYFLNHCIKYKVSNVLARWKV